MMMPIAVAPDSPADLSDAGVAALQFALDLTLADNPPDKGRVEQVKEMLRERNWYEVASFCSYHQQMARLNFLPAQSPPCWIHDLEEANAILRQGPVLACDGSGADVSSCPGARILKRMLSFGISPYHPDPIAAIAVKGGRANTRHPA
jgi:hypothetical protein